MGARFGYKPPPDLWIYELALDMKLSPNEVRRMHARDINHLILVNAARKEARIDIAKKYKLPLSEVPLL